MELISEFLSDCPVDVGSGHFPGPPDGIENSVDVFPSVSQLRRWDISERFCAVLCFVMATDVIPAGVADPERQSGEISSSRVDSRSAGESGIHRLSASAAEDTHRRHLFGNLSKHSWQQQPALRKSGHGSTSGHSSMTSAISAWQAQQVTQSGCGVLETGSVTRTAIP